MKCKFLVLWCGLWLWTAVSAAQTVYNWASFNIRYDNPEDGVHNWRYRKDSVAAFIRTHRLDVVGMQEVLHNQLEDLKDRLPGYTAVGVGREDGKTKGEYSPLFFRTDRFDLVDSHTFWLSQYPDSAGFIGWDGACTRIATWAKLRDKQSGKTLLAINTHFDHVGKEARRKGALLIIDRVKKLAQGCPVVLTGDFNVSEKWEAYQTITSNSFILRDSYKIAEKKEGVPYTFHDFGQLPMREREKIDFLFVTPGICVMSVLIPKEDKEKPLSDHNPEVAVLRFP